MTKMIRCIEGHVFDADTQTKCPQCGWEPSAKKEKPTQAAKASALAPVGALFGALINAVDKLLGMVGLRNKLGLAPGIVYACVILLFVGCAFALSGVFRGDSNTTPVNTPTNTPTNVNLQPQQKEIPKTPSPQQAPQKQAQPQQQGPGEQGSPSGPPQQTPPQQQQVAPQQQYQQQQRPRVEDEIRRAIRRIF